MIWILASAPHTASAGVPGSDAELTLPPALDRRYQTAYGREVAWVDADGDGYADAVVAAHSFSVTDLSYAGPASEEGLVTLHRGSATGLLPASWWALGTPDSAFGLSLASGDLDGDGFGDLAIAAPRPGDGTLPDRVEVWYGSATGFAAAPDGTLSGTTNTRFGESLAIVDVDADGADDVVVGVADEGVYGAVLLFRGGPAGLEAGASWRIDGTAAAPVGTVLSAAGDVNGDGYGDVVIGRPYADADLGSAEVYLGSAAGLDATPAWTVAGTPTVRGLGFEVAGAGDVDGDGFGDVLVGAPNDGPAGAHSGGEVFLFRGSATGPEALPSWHRQVSYPYGGLGTAMAPAGDLDADGYDDVVIGAPGVLGAGAVAFFHGSALGLPAAPARVVRSTTASAAFGESVAAGGDADGDGIGDVLVGASRYDNGNHTDGAAFLLRGP